MPIPQTVEEARAQGYPIERKTLDEANDIIRQALGAGFEARRPPKDCSTIPPNGLCWEGDCDAFGMKEVLYCDGVQGCTIYAKVRC